MPRSPSSVSSNGTTASAPSGSGAPVMIRMAAPCFTLCEGTSPAAMELDDVQRHRRVRVGVRDVGRLERVPVHRRVVPWRHVELADDILGQHLSERVRYRTLFRSKLREEAVRMRSRASSTEIMSAWWCPCRCSRCLCTRRSPCKRKPLVRSVVGATLVIARSRPTQFHLCVTSPAASRRTRALAAA